MSLTATDLQDIRTIMHEEIHEEVPKIIDEQVPEIVRKIIGEEMPPIIDERVLKIIRADVRPIVREEVRREVGPLEGWLMAVENDVKEIYFMISDLQKQLPAVRAAN
jgi:hypothetical protein